MIDELLTGKTLDFQQKKYICNEMMTCEPRMEALILKNFTEEDFAKINQRRIGTGQIGGKACGVLVARKLIKNHLPEYTDSLLPHNSWFIGSDVYLEYMREKTLSDKVETGLYRLMHSLGNDPIVIRSSSILEDGFDHGFFGKYSTVFCVNQGTLKSRIQALKTAILKVYESVSSASAVEYRRTRGVSETEEQMALLVQRVEGSCRGEYYMPLASGIGCSYNPYKWMENMDPHAGMLRLVVGLGTRAVERTPGDYPRLVDLSRSKGNLYTTVAERHKHSQRHIDVLDMNVGKVVSIPLQSLLSVLNQKEIRKVLSHDVDAEAMLEERGQYRAVYFADCNGIVYDNAFISMIKKILKMLEREYERPVDIEFAIGLGYDGKIKMNLYQCRPLRQITLQNVEIPDRIEGEVLFDIKCASMWRSKAEKLDVIVWVDPQKYYECPYVQKSSVGPVIGLINRYFKDSGYKMLLLAPGRIGTSSPELGVTANYVDVSCFSALCEVAYSKAGCNPDLSYGSHMFQELVEADVFYGAITENSNTRIYCPEILEGCKNTFEEICPEKAEFKDMIKVYEVSKDNAWLWLDSKAGRAICQIKK